MTVTSCNVAGCHHHDAVDLEPAELLTIEPSCLSTDHDFDVVMVPRFGDHEPALYCRQCGQVRKITVPA